jgi:tRNA(Ile)-lysidine synthase
MMRTYLEKSVIKLSLAPQPPGVKAVGHGLPGPGSLLVGVSGGADSVALACMLHALAAGRGWRLTLGHVDHGLRPDSAEDAHFVAGLAEELGLPFLERRVQVKANGRSLEEAAREERRAALMDMARQAGVDVIALAHHADDQAETLLARLLQGTGATGLAGMRFWNPPFWRPLLELRRNDLRDWLKARGRTWREDPSNQDTGPLRNRVRHELLPLAEDLVNPRAVEALGRLAKVCADEETFWEDWCQAQAEKWVRAEGTSLVLSLDDNHELGPAALRRMLRWMAGRLLGGGQHLLALHLKQMEELAQGRAGRRLTLPGGLMAWREKEGLRLDVGEIPPDFTYTLHGPGWVWLPHLRSWLAVEEAPEPKEFKARGPEVFIPANRVVWPILIRPPKPGERFKPMGAPGSKRLSRFLIDQKAPPWWRKRTVMAADRRGTWWAGPWSLAERARKKPGESKYLRLRFVDTNGYPSYTIGFGGADHGPLFGQTSQLGVSS